MFRSIRTILLTGALIGAAIHVTAAAAWAQAVPHMRTRYFTSLTNPEIEQYLKRNDIIIVPVGTIGVEWEPFPPTSNT